MAKFMDLLEEMEQGKQHLCVSLQAGLKQTDGRLALFGISGGTAYSKQLRKVGALIESPTFYSSLTLLFTANRNRV